MAVAALTMCGAYVTRADAATTIPATIEAEWFDGGGEGVGYHEWSPANWGGAYRTSEAVDIRSSVDQPNSNFIVTNFDVGEWLAYTIDVPVTGNYDWGVRASSAYGASAYHFEIDGQNVTGQVTVPYTYGWNAFRWVAAPTVWLTAGRHVLRVVADVSYFDLDLIVIFASSAPAAPQAQAQAVQSAGVAFSCSFNNVPDCNFIEQAKVTGGRAWLSNISRDGGGALNLYTQPGDTDVVGSGAMERDDVYLATPGTAGAEIYVQGQEQWFAHSILFPSDFAMPTWEDYVVFYFHNTALGPWQANFHVAFGAGPDPNQPGQLKFIGYGGQNSGDNPYGATYGQVQQNVWYDFVYHVRWSAGNDGFFEAWVNGKYMFWHQGPTLYNGQGVYLKLANYHNPICHPHPWPYCPGPGMTSSVIHDRVLRGTSAKAVAIGPLEGIP